MAELLPARVLVIAAHPDDEVLMAGGAMAKYGWDHVIYGLGRGDLLDQRFDTIPLVEITQHFEKVLADWRPELIVTHDPADLNEDHRVIFRAVMNAARPVNYGGAIWTAEVPGSSDWSDEAFHPNCYVRLEPDHLATKIKRMQAYESERREPPHPRSPLLLEARARYHGAAIGASLAEAFRVIREIR